MNEKFIPYNILYAAPVDPAVQEYLRSLTTVAEGGILEYLKS